MIIGCSILLQDENLNSTILQALSTTKFSGISNKFGILSKRTLLSVNKCRFNQFVPAILYRFLLLRTEPFALKIIRLSP